MILTARSRIRFNLYLITDRQQTGGRDLCTVVEQAIEGGVRAVQLREKDLSTRELYELAYDLRRITARHNARLFINDRIDIALAVDADGVHLGTNSMPVYKARRLMGERKLIGVSCHNQVSAITAQEKGADFITFGPVYHTPSKAQYGEPLGLDRLEQVIDLLEIPVFALGGVNASKTTEVLARGAHGISLISGIMAAADPKEAARSLISLLPATDLQE